MARTLLFASMYVKVGMLVLLFVIGAASLGAGCVGPPGNITTPTPTPTTPVTTTQPTAAPAETTQAAGSTTSMTPGVIAGTGTPGITILFPQPYSAVTSTDVEVGVLVDNFSLGESGSAGHIIYYLDAQAVTARNVSANMTLTSSNGTFAVSTNTTYTWKNLSPGNHGFAVELVDQNNKPLEPPVMAVSEPVVVGPNATAPPTPTGPILTLGTITPLPPVTSQATNTTATSAATTAATNATTGTTATTATPSAAVANVTTTATPTATTTATNVTTTATTAMNTTAATATPTANATPTGTSSSTSYTVKTSLDQSAGDIPGRWEGNDPVQLHGRLQG